MNATLPLHLSHDLRDQLHIAVIGLGYVGLPVAVAFGAKFNQVCGFDSNPARIEQLRKYHDHTLEIASSTLKDVDLRLIDDPANMRDANFFVIAVPTPIDENKEPDLTPLRNACRTISPLLKRDDIVVFESTVYPGVTEDICGPWLEEHSDLRANKDFLLGYSPERINPGDHEHRLENITKIVACNDERGLEILAKVYETIITAGVHRAQSIKVAEAAKVIENTQRDVNIALMNELAVIFDAMGISTQQVLAAANTKWNFLSFQPGLVGGHCIGVDPYYLLTAAKAHGFNPALISAARERNDTMGAFIVDKIKTLCDQHNITISGARCAILGVSFKENVGDIRNSVTPQMAKMLKALGVEVHLYDPTVLSENLEQMYDLSLKSEYEDTYDIALFAVPHDAFGDDLTKLANDLCKTGGVCIDIKHRIVPQKLRDDIHLWSV